MTLKILGALLRLASHLTKAEIGLLACIGVSTLIGLAIIIVGNIAAAARWFYYGPLRRGIKARRIGAQLRDLDAGTCDGWNAAQIADLLEESWTIERR